MCRTWNPTQSSARNWGSREGFTLIELIVVISIIGILAAISIPTFLSQRGKSYDAAAKSDLRQLAQFQEIYLTDAASYGTIAQIEAVDPHLEVSRGVTLSVIRFNGATSYCLSAHHASSAETWFYDSLAGGLQPSGTTGCPVTTVGTSGDSVVG